MKKNYVFVVVVLVLIASLIVGCTPMNSEPQSLVDLEGTSWTLRLLRGEDLDGDGKATLIFSDGLVHGAAACNSFSGSYKLDGETLTLGTLAATMMACENMETEQLYLEALGTISAFRIENGELVLDSKDEDALLVFEPTQHASFEGTTWQLVNVSDGSGVVSAPEYITVTATFSEEEVSGSAGCNQYFAPYTLDGNKLSVGPIGSTKMYCEEPAGIMDQEPGFLNALGSAATFEIEGDTLRVFNASGEIVVVFNAAE